jgi:L-threonylcarbamoyladenylate synthase
VTPCRLNVSLRRIRAYLKRGGLIAYPTESCYGLGCDPNNRSAVLRILKLKQRPQSKGLILVAGRFAQVVPFIEPLDREQQEVLKHGGAQAVTYLMPAKKSCPRWLRGKHSTLAVRITAHPYAASLCKGLDMALVSTSANFSGGRPVRTFKECQRLFVKSVWVLQGKTGLRKRPSTIRNWTDGRILRK